MITACYLALANIRQTLMNLNHYINILNQRFQSAQSSSKYSFRGNLQKQDINIVKAIEVNLRQWVMSKIASPNPSKGGEILHDIRLDSYSSNTRYKNSSPLEGLGEANYGYATGNPKTYALIKEMRNHLKNNPTHAEKIIWEYLRNQKTGHKIRRQHIIDNFVADFICLLQKVVIEIDGKIHLKQKEYDALRTEKLNQLGYEVIRFANEDIFNDPQSCAHKIKQHLDVKQSSTNLSVNPQMVTPIDLIDYIYAILHSPTYRNAYKEFLQMDFLRVPYPQDQKEFWQLVKLGGQLRQYHLIEHKGQKESLYSYPQSGSNQITRKIAKTDFVIIDIDKQIGQVWINNDQYFDSVPKCAWEFYIGGYQPAQKWLKDRKKKVLTLDDIRYYFKIIGALVKTGEIMRMIDGELV